MNRTIATAVFGCLAVAALAGKADFKPVELKTEYQVHPLGIEVQQPRFSWQMKALSPRRGMAQTAYRIVVTDDSGNNVWDSGKVASDNSLNIRYDGERLLPATAYEWKLEVWNDKGDCSDAQGVFETGLMCRGDKDAAWGGARWIGGGDDDQPLYSQYLTVFKLDYTITLDEASGSTKGALVYGADDERLMSPYTNLYHLDNGAGESYVSAELDIAPLAVGGEAVLNFYRSGYKPDDDADVPVASLNIPKGKINLENRYAPHRFVIKSNSGITEVFVDGEDAASSLGEVELNPLGRGGDFIAFPALAHVGSRLRPGQAARFSDVKIRHFREPSNVIREISVDASPGTISVADPSRNAMPMLRTEFNIPAGKKIKKARIYSTARGIYDLWLNGRQVSDQWYNPGVTQYNKEHLYQVFDVTDFIHNGDNALGAILGEGWWSGEISMIGELWNYFGDRQSLLAKLEITYDDGSRQNVVTNPATWQYCSDGPVVYGSMYQGEVYDARREAAVEGWDCPGFSGNGWKPAAEIDIEKTKTTHSQPGWEPASDYSGYRLSAHAGQPVRELAELKAVAVEEVKPGVWVYDMGQNMAGVPSVRLHGMKPGTEVHLHFAEMLYPQLPEYGDDAGMIMYENYRQAMSHDVYVCRGGDEEFTPRRTLHGFRYIEVTGVDAPLALDDVRGKVLTSIDKIRSDYTTSNEKVNRLWQNILWSTYANFLSLPTDCPQRNERLGWSGDISVFSRTASHLAEMPMFLRRHLSQMRNCQTVEGKFPDIAPLSGGFGGFLWGSAGITVPWELWLQYGDRDMLAEHYDAMKRYINYVEHRYYDRNSGVMVQQPGWNLSDWLGLEDNKNDKSLLWETYYIYDLDILARMADVLGRSDDAEHYRALAAGRRKFFNDTYVDTDGRTVASGVMDGLQKGQLIDIQTSYVLPLMFNAVDSVRRGQMQRHLVAAIERSNITDTGVECPPYSLMTGFIGTAWINPVLSDAGRSDVAYRLLQQTSYPSWLYPVEQGATTIWERLNSYTHRDGFGGNNRMNSFNHYSFGAVGGWMLGNSLGIRRDDTAPAFKHFFLAPEPDPTGEMTRASGHYESLHGRIESSWEQLPDGTLAYRCTVPANTTATLTLPTAASAIRESGRPLKKARGITQLPASGASGTVMELASGEYRFVVAK